MCSNEGYPLLLLLWRRSITLSLVEAVNYLYSCGDGPLHMLLWRWSSTLALMKWPISLSLVVAVHYCYSLGGAALFFLK